MNLQSVKNWRIAMKKIDEVLREFFNGDDAIMQKILDEGGIIAVKVDSKSEDCHNLLDGITIHLKSGERRVFFVHRFSESGEGSLYGTYLEEWVRFPGDSIANNPVFDGTLTLFLLEEGEKVLAKKLLAQIAEEDDIARRELDKLS